MQPRKLRSRPLLEATLGYEDLRDAVKAGGHALLALTGQAVTFKERAFVRFLANPAALDSYLLALVVQLSRGHVSGASWVPEALRRIQRTNDVRDVLPLPYVLLSPRWLVA